jgi:fumarylacetoacetase
MKSELNRTHDPDRTSWVASANGHSEFPIQNLPFGATPTGLVVAIGDQALPLASALDAGWGSNLGEAAQALRSESLNALMALPPGSWQLVRAELSDALSDPSWREALEQLLQPIDSLQLGMPFYCRDYTDFYASIHHATNVGSMFRPDNPLLPNYKWVPIGYHGRASTIVASGTPVHRPVGQTRPTEGEAPPVGPSKSLDYEMELGIVLGGANQLGEPVIAANSEERIFGVVLLNDWSARDMQAWEYQPLGPFLAKNFVSTVSPWVVTAEALRPYAVPMPARPAGDPAPLEYLDVPGDHTWAIELDVELTTAAMRERVEEPFRVSRGRFEGSMYWSPAQLVAHHGSNGCVLNPGDLLGTGTISGTTDESRGCLLERTWRGAEPLTLPDGSERRFLEDGDEVTLRGHCGTEGRPTIGFGSCQGRVQSA